MTVSTTTYFVTVLGNGVTTVFNFDFVPDNAGTMQVVYIDAALIETVLAPSQYTLTINTPASGQLWGVGGTVTYPLSGSPIAIGTKLRIQRIEPYIQTVSINNQGAFYPRAVEQAIDKLELQIQQLTGGPSGGTGGLKDKEIAFEWIGDTVPVSNQVIALVSFPVAVTFLENFSGSTGKTLTNPAATFVANITKNGTNVGTMAISTSGIFTFTACACDLIYSVGDYLSVIAPSTVDTTIKNFAWTFKGTMN